MCLALCRMFCRHELIQSSPPFGAGAAMYRRVPVRTLRARKRNLLVSEDPDLHLLGLGPVCPPAEGSRALLGSTPTSRAPTANTGAERPGDVGDLFFSGKLALSWGFQNPHSQHNIRPVTLNRNGSKARPLI